MQSSHDRRAFTKIVIIITACFACAALFSLVPAREASNPTAAHLRVAIAALAMATSTGAGIWFISNLHFFTARLRRAYALVSIGFITLGLALLQLPVLGLFNMWDSFWISSGAVVAVFAATPLLIYSGMRQYARVVHAKSLAMSYKLIWTATIIFAVGTYLISPHLIWYPDVPGLPTYLAVAASTLVFLTAAAQLSWRLSRSMGSSYHDAMRWLSVALTALAFAAAHEYLTAYMENDTDVLYLDYGIYLLPFVVSGFFALRASYAFEKLTHTTVVGGTNTVGVLTDEDYTDSITTLATCASNPQDIDKLLDQMRVITANLSPGAPLHDADKQKLITTYMQLEAYLTSGKDPARVYTLNQLRERLNPAFVALLPTGKSQQAVAAST